MVIRRIGVLSLAKISAALHGAIGLILGIFFALASLLGGALGQAAREAAAPEIIAVLFGFGAIVFMPFLYAIMGFLVGVVSAFVYNSVAKLAGGLVLEIDG
jgi:hypothetical protein